MEYQQKGQAITVHRDRYTYGAPDAIRGHAGNNEGSYNNISDDTTEFTFGPCMVEDITLTKARKVVAFWSSDFRTMLNEMVKPKIRRYMFLDGQRLVLAQSEGMPPMLFADSHASFDDDLWLEQFPEEHRG